jgi:hypothetical protein
MIAEVELDGPGQVTIGQEAVYDVFVTFEGEPYMSEFIKEVKILLFDSNNEIVYIGEATMVEEGLYEAVLPADVTAQLAAGANKIEVAVVSTAVSIPTFEGLEFVTAP